MGLAGVVFVVFLILKLVGVIAWSWLWVTSPLWIGLALWLVYFGVILVFQAIAAVFIRKRVRSFLG